MQSLGGQTSDAFPFSSELYFTALTFLLPASVMVMSLGNFMIGEEGQAVWRIYASPISARGLVKSKYFFIVLFASIVLTITGTLGSLVFHPSPLAIIVASFEAVFLIFALGIISLTNGIVGADFTETPRPRMIRQSKAILNLIACALAGVAILAPFIPYFMSSTFSIIMPGLNIPFLNNPKEKEDVKLLH